MRQIIKISAILMILLIASTVIVTSASQKSNNPTLPAPLPAPSERDKVQHIVEDLVANATKNATANPTITFVNPPKIEVIGNLFVLTNDIEDQYLVGCCVGFFLPIKMEVWGDNLNPISGINTYSYLYYWDYTINGWRYYSSTNKNTDGNGIAKYGYFIPNRFTDRLWLFLFTDSSNKYQVTERWINIQWV